MDPYTARVVRHFAERGKDPGKRIVPRWAVVGIRDGFRCYLCGASLYVPPSKVRRVKVQAAITRGRLAMTLDHVTPKCRGGASTPSNVRASCFTCNQSKGSWTYTELLLGFKLGG